MSKQILTFLLTLFIGSAIAQTGDSLHYLLPQDTVYLETNGLKQQIHTHQITQGQTLYSLAKFYGLKYNDLLYYNQNLVGQTISIGQTVKVPIPLRAILPTQTDYYVDTTQLSPVCYVVKAGDTYYGVARRNFEMTVDSLKQMNPTVPDVLEIGQILKLGWLSPLGIPDSLHGDHASPLVRKDMLLSERFATKAQQKKEYSEAGVAFWQKKRDAGNQLYALHRRAPVNSVLRITNPMTKAVVHAKVIGKLPDSAYTRDIIVVISPRVAELLGAKDPRFYVKLKYLR